MEFEANNIILEINKKFNEFQQQNKDDPEKQFFVGIAGIPGGGKSTLTNFIVNQIGSDICKVIPLDGYHLYLKELTPEQLKRRGAPDTFNKLKFKEDIEELILNRSNTFPSFSHSVKDPVENDISIEMDTKLIIVEGLYLFMKDWEVLDLFNMKVFIKCNQDEADSRVAKRNFKAGIYPSMDAAFQYAKNNDRANAQLILENSVIDAETIVYDTSSSKNE